MTKRKTATPDQIDHLMFSFSALIEKYTDGWGDVEGLQIVEEIVNEVFEESKLDTPGRITFDWGMDSKCYWGFNGR